jgi:ribosomal protein L11 methyltransferase
MGEQLRTPTAANAWLEIGVAADDEAVEAVAEILRRHGQGVAIDEPFLQPSLDEPPERDPARRCIVKTYLPDDAAADATRRAIEEALWHLGRLASVEPLDVRRISEEDWATAWKSFFPVLRAGRRTVIVPSWRRYRSRHDDLVVRLDPGLAFGTGTHPTTRLCLLAAEELVQPGMLVLDAGTGSGILAITAARLGAAHVVAVDTDAMAVRAAGENVSRNRVRRRITVLAGSPEMLSCHAGLATGRDGAHIPKAYRGRLFDLILSNITARANAALLVTYAALLQPGGRVVASGILEEHLPLVTTALDEAGLRRLATTSEGDWVCITAERDAPSGDRPSTT